MTYTGPGVNEEIKVSSSPGSPPHRPGREKTGSQKEWTAQVLCKPSLVPAPLWATSLSLNSSTTLSAQQPFPHLTKLNLRGLGCDHRTATSSPSTHQCTRQFPPLSRQQWMKLIHSLKCFLLEKKAIEEGVWGGSPRSPFLPTHGTSQGQGALAAQVSRWVQVCQAVMEAARQGGGRHSTEPPCRVLGSCFHCGVSFGLSRK